MLTTALCQRIPRSERAALLWLALELTPDAAVYTPAWVQRSRASPSSPL